MPDRRARRKRRLSETEDFIMNRRAQKLAAIAAAAILTATTARAIGIGDAAPDFTLTDTDGRTHSLADYRGSVVFLNFFGWS